MPQILQLAKEDFASSLWVKVFSHSLMTVFRTQQPLFPFLGSNAFTKFWECGIQQNVKQTGGVPAEGLAECQIPIQTEQTKESQITANLLPSNLLIKHHLLNSKCLIEGAEPQQQRFCRDKDFCHFKRQHCLLSCQEMRLK